MRWQGCAIRCRHGHTVTMAGVVMVRRRLVAVRRNLVAIAIVVPGGSGSSLTAAIKRLGRMRCAARPKDKHQHESADERQETAHSFSLPALPRKGKETLPKRHHRSIVDIGREGSARRAGPPLLVDQRRLRARERLGAVVLASNSRWSPIRRPDGHISSTQVREPLSSAGKTYFSQESLLAARATGAGSCGPAPEVRTALAGWSSVARRSLEDGCGLR